MHFTWKQNKVQAFGNLHVRPIILFCGQYFLQEVFVRFYFIVKITAGTVSIDFASDKGFHVLLQNSASVIRHVIHDRKSSLNGS